MNMDKHPNYYSLKSIFQCIYCSLSYLIKITGIIASKTKVPAVNIISSVGTRVDKYVPNGTNKTLAIRINKLIS